MQTSSRGPTRRRVLTILAAAAALPLTGAGSRSGYLEWTGTALGADAKMVLWGDDDAAARAAIEDCLAEVERLERIFSLYREGSEIRRLNETGYLAAPSQDMRLLLATSRNVSELTDGLFDPTVQPLWELYADWFAANAGPGGPPARAVELTLGRVGYKRLKTRPDLVRLAPNGRLTLNGIAQGYITDRIADLLRARGWTHVLVNMGELRALGAKPDGRPWRVSLREAGIDLPLTDAALATSAGEAFTFAKGGRVSHLIDPKTGRSPRRYRSLTAGHKSAAVADAMSTGLYAAPPQTVRRIVARVPGLRVWALDAAGELHVFGA